MDKDEAIKMVLKHYLVREIEVSKRQATKEFITNLDKVIDKSIDDLTRVILQAIKEEA